MKIQDSPLIRNTVSVSKERPTILLKFEKWMILHEAIAKLSHYQRNVNKSSQTS